MVTEIEKAKPSQVIRYETDRGEVALSTEIVRRIFCPLATPAESYIFVKMCQQHRLDPFLKEIYIVKYQSDEPASFIIGKEAWLQRLDQHPNFDKIVSGIILLKEDKLEYRPTTFVLPDENLVGGWAEVHRKDRSEPIRIEVALQDYDTNYKAWRTKKATMIRKVAVVQATREAIPGLFAGLYEDAESGNVVSIEAPEEGFIIEGDPETKAFNEINYALEGALVDPPESVTAPPKPPEAPPKPEKRLSRARPSRAPIEMLRRLNEVREQNGVPVEKLNEWIDTNFDSATARTLTEGEVNLVIAAIQNKSLAGADTVEAERQNAITTMLRYADAYNVTREQVEEWILTTYQLTLDQIGEDHANSIKGAIQTGLLTAPHEPDIEAMADPEQAEIPPDQEMLAESEAGNTLPLLPFE